MFRAIQIDPETLAINVNAEAISDHPSAKKLFAFIDEARAEGVMSPLMSACDKGDIELVSFGSSFLHEYRHFGDLLLSPFGFYRIRTAFEFYFNFPALLLNSKDDIAIPLMSGMDPVTRSVIGLTPEFEKSLQYRIGLSPFSRVRLINRENHYDPSTSHIKIGGDRILEGLAYITQFEFLFHRFSREDGLRYFRPFFEPYSGSSFDHAYRWFIPEVHKLHPGEVMPNNTLIGAILFASLCGSISIRAPMTPGPRPTIVPSRDVGVSLPSARYYQLVEFFLRTPRPSIPEPAEAFRLVDDACMILFGKDLISEVREDLNFSREFVDKFRSHQPQGRGIQALLNPVPFLEELVDYRESLLNAFACFPPAFCTAQGFYQSVGTLLRPSLIYHSPRGITRSSGIKFSGKVKRWVGLIDRTFEPPPNSQVFPEAEPFVYASWAPVVGDNGSRASIGDDESDEATLNVPGLASRQGVYGIFAPLYRWMLYGNKYRSMSEVENEDFFSALGLDASRFKIDPMYVEAEDISFPDQFFDFYANAPKACDICRGEVHKGTSFLVSSRTMRQNKNVTNYWKTFNSDVKFVFSYKDWSDWLLCEADMHRFGFEIPQREAESV